MEGGSSNKDASEPKSGCGCSGVAVDNDPKIASAVDKKLARRTATLAAVKANRAQADTKAALRAAEAAAAEVLRHREQLNLREEMEKRQTDDRQTAANDNTASGGTSTSANGSSSAASGNSPNAVAMDEASEITITVSPTTGGQFDLSVLKTDSVESLKKVISKRLRVPKERICLLYRER